MISPKISSAKSDAQKLLFCIEHQSRMLNTILHRIEGTEWEEREVQLLTKIDTMETTELETIMDNSTIHNWNEEPYYFVTVISLLQNRILKRLVSTINA